MPTAEFIGGPLDGHVQEFAVLGPVIVHNMDHVYKRREGRAYVYVGQNNPRFVRLPDTLHYRVWDGNS